jgi:hypothetical protein
MANTVAGLFKDIADAQALMDDLLRAGFPRDSISLVTNAQTLDEKPVGPAFGEDEINEDKSAGTAARAVAGGVLGGTAGVLAAAAALAVPGIGLALAVGPAMTILGAAVAGALGGGAIGALTHVGIPEEHAHIYAEGVRRGLTLVTVTGTDAQAARAARLMHAHQVMDVEEHAGEWRKRGWAGFDVQAPPLTRPQLARERQWMTPRAAKARVYDVRGRAPDKSTGAGRD